jgi:hypothetical protein
MKYLKKEQHMFKKTLLASAMMTLAAGAYATPTFENENGGADLTVTYSTEGAQSATAINTGQIFINFGVEYRVGDEITITFSSPFASGFDLDAAFGSTTHSTVGGDGELTLGLIDSTDDSITLRVTEIVNVGGGVGAVVTKGSQVELTQNGDVELDGASVRANEGATMTYSAVASRVDGTSALDGGPVTGISVIDFATQYTASVTVKLDAEIDVELQDGLRDAVEVDYFTGNADQYSSAVLYNQTQASFEYIDSYAYDDDGRAPVIENTLRSTTLVDQFGEDLWVAYVDQEIGQEYFQSMTDNSTRTEFVTVDSDFFFVEVVDHNIEGDADIDNVGTDATILGYYVELSGFGDVDLEDVYFNLGFIGADISDSDWDDEAGVIWYYNDSAAETGIEFSPYGVMAEADITVNVDVDYEDTGADHSNGGVDDVLHTDALLTDADGGEWVFNGTTVTLYAVPWSAGVIDQFIWLTNSGELAAEVTASVTYNDGSEGGAVSTVNLGSIIVAEPGLTNLGESLGAALEALSPNGRGTITLVTSADRSVINVDASYKHMSDKDRLRIETSQTLNERSVESSKAID